MNERSLLSRPGVRRVLAGVSAIALVVAAAVHLAAVLGVDLTAGEAAPFIALHVGIFPLFFAALLSLGGEEAGVPPKDKMKRLVARVPRGWRYAALALFYYAAANFVLFLLATGGGSAEQCNGEYVSTSHGRVVRILTREEYDAMKVWLVRGFSGHWLAFYLVPVLAFGVLRPRAGAAPASPLVRGR